MQLVAGMLSFLHRGSAAPAMPAAPPCPNFQLVSWRAGARTRREDELARWHESHGG
ncbi:hypothetical protein [Fulvimonas soli]|uniref:Uncharacterized protein n=2 Tax=Fulvimonas soli TaxID=155197 RepID=A0A316IGL4_9GAMM|nr:hypothetical protein [Fulvimonas soli]PWK92682.1 hypothetical protein C7456_10114 [Fulvimonas soli]